MEFRDAIKKILKDNGYSQTRMAEKMGYKNTSGLSEQLRNNNMSIKVLLKIVNELNYEIRLVPKGNLNKHTSREAVAITSAKE